jgi:N-acetyl-gamma-glutamyl-phosphate reductase
MNRGILVTAYANLKNGVKANDINAVYKAKYGDEFFIRLYNNDGDSTYTLPETRWVKGSNFCDIGLTVDERNNRLIAIGAIDNLVKGAAGQAIQNMNVLFGFDEHTGLKQMPIFPA